MEREKEPKPAPAKVKSRPLTYEHEIPVTRVRWFWEGVAEGKVMATRCTRCGERYYPPQADCPKCLASEMEWFQVGEQAVLKTYTESRLNHRVSHSTPNRTSSPSPKPPRVSE